MEFITPIFTRTEDDLKELESFQKIGYEYLNADQKSKWMEGMIGALNATDLNRIENNIMFLSLIISAMSPRKVYKTDWLMTDFVKMNDFLRIYRNLLDLMYAFGFGEETPKPPYDTIDKVNKAEELLNNAYLIISSMLRNDSFKTVNGEYFKTVNGEYFHVTTNTLRKQLKTVNGEKFVTADNMDFVVFG